MLLDAGAYDPDKVQADTCQVFYGPQAEEKFREVLLGSGRLRDSGLFGAYIRQEDDTVAFVQEEVAVEYSPELNYVIFSGGHGYARCYDLAGPDEIRVNPSTYLYSPSRKYRFGTFGNDGIRYYIEVKEKESYISYPIDPDSPGEMSGVYWQDDRTLHYLVPEKSPDGTLFYRGYAIRILD